MTQGRKIKLYLVDGTILDGDIYDVDERRDTITIKTETELIEVDNNDIMRLTIYNRRK